MFKDLKKKNDGFTIIEVLIVLAIAGLILLVVFLAVPALQRNSRNTSRNNDGARLAALATECLANRNGVVASCDSVAEIGFAADDFSIINNINVTTASGNTAFAVGADTEGVTAVISFSTECTADGSGKQATTNTRKFTVGYNTETGSGGLSPRCIGSE